MVIFETIFTLDRSYRVSNARISQLIAPLIRLPGLRLEGKELLLQALDIFGNSSLSFADAYNIAVMRSNNVLEIYSWDTDFDRIQDISRLEP